MTLRVLFDGVEYPVTVRRGHWLPRWLRTDGTSVGLTIYLRKGPGERLSDTLLGHELVHTLDFVRLWNRTPLRLFWLAVAADLALYLFDWVRAGFRYRQMAEEIRAYAEQASVIAGEHPHIRIVYEAQP